MKRSQSGTGTRCDSVISMTLCPLYHCDDDDDDDGERKVKEEKKRKKIQSLMSSQHLKRKADCKQDKTSHTPVHEGILTKENNLKFVELLQPSGTQ